MFTERFLAKNSPNFNNIFNHFLSLGDDVKENVILIYNLIHSKENEVYLDENNIYNSINNEINNENIARRTSLFQKKYTRGSVVNNNDNQNNDIKSRTRRKHVIMSGLINLKNYVLMNMIMIVMKHLRLKK